MGSSSPRSIDMDRTELLAQERLARCFGLRLQPRDLVGVLWLERVWAKEAGGIAKTWSRRVGARLQGRRPLLL